MRFRNLCIYRLPADSNIDAGKLEKLLAARPLQPCGGFEMESHGWVRPQPESGFLYALNRHWLCALGSAQKILPASVVRQIAAERADELAAKQGHPVGRKQMREIKARVLDELLPRALTRRQITSAWIDPAGRWLVVDTAAEARAERLLETLRRSGHDVTARRLDTRSSPAAAMTGWLANGEVPGEFTLDQDLELMSGEGNKAIVRYVRHGLDGKDIRAHIAGGKVATRVGMTWKDRISFVLTERLQIKRVAFVNILDHETAQDAENEQERFDLDFALMTGEFASFLADLVKLLGGEKPLAA